MPGPMMPPGGQPGADPVALMQALRALLPTTIAAPEPIYPRWFKKPPAKDPGKIWEIGQRLHNDHGELRAFFDEIIRRLRPGRVVGCFPEDIEARRTGDQEEWHSSSLIDEHQHVVGLLADMDFVVKKPIYDQANQVAAMQVQDAIWHLRQEEIRRHQNAGNKWLPIDEANTLLTYGMLVNRTVIDLDDPEFPFDSRLIDPAQVYARWDGKRGLKELYRVYQARIEDLLADYGDLTTRHHRRVRDLLGGGNDYDTTEVMVVEFWDRWRWTALIMDGVPIKPAVEHRYGYVPWTIQYGPLGEPMFTMAQTADPRYEQSIDAIVYGDDRREDALRYKLTPYIGPMVRRHDQFEAVMARVLTGLKKSIDPPLKRLVDPMIQGQERPEFDLSAGKVNEVKRGLEDIEPILGTMSPFEVQTLLTALNSDRLTGSLSPTAMGANDRSNVSGSAQHAMADAGAAKLVKWERSLASYHERRFGQWLLSWRNFGHLATYAGDAPTPLVFPYRRRPQGQGVAFELTPETVDAVGWTVEVELKRTRRDQLLPMANFAKLANEAGLITKKEGRERYLGLSDYEHAAEEWMEEFAIDQAYRHPLFAQLFTVPAMITAELEEAEGDPERQQTLQTMLALWNQAVIGQGQGTGAPPGASGGGPPPANPNPTTSAGVSFPELSQGPGSVSGQPGGPPPAPPGSVMIPPTGVGG